MEFILASEHGKTNPLHQTTLAQHEGIMLAEHGGIMCAPVSLAFVPWWRRLSESPVGFFRRRSRVDMERSSVGGTQ